MRLYLLVGVIGTYVLSETCSAMELPSVSWRMHFEPAISQNGEAHPAIHPVFQANGPMFLNLVIQNYSNESIYVDQRFLLYSSYLRLANNSIHTESDIIESIDHQRAPISTYRMVPPNDQSSLPVDLRELWGRHPEARSITPGWQYPLYEPGECVLNFEMGLYGPGIEEGQDPVYWAELGRFLATLHAEPFHFTITDPNLEELVKLAANIQDPNVPEATRLNNFSTAVYVYPQHVGDLIDYFESSNNEAFQEQAALAREHIRIVTARNNERAGTTAEP